MNPLSRFSALLRIPALAFACAAAGAIAASSSRNDEAGPAIELPKFVVTEMRILPEPESWRYGTIPGFEILTNASDRETQKLVREFELFRNVLDVVWPMPNQMRTPMYLIVCGGRAKFDQFQPRGDGLTPQEVSLFLTGRNRAAIVIDAQTRVLDLKDSAMFNLEDGPEDFSRVRIEHDKRLYREYVRYLLSRCDPRLPAWFEEGMTQIIMAMKFDRTSIEIGTVEPANTISAEAEAARSANEALGGEGGPMVAPPAAQERDFNAILKDQTLLPLEQLLTAAHDSPEALDPLSHTIWAKEAYAFVHLCLYGQGGKWRNAFAKYILRTSREPATEAVFKECFGKSYKEMALELRMYIEFTDYQAKRYQAAKGKGFPEPAPLALRDATPAEVGVIKGNTMLMANRVDDARAEFITPYMRGSRDPRLLSALGYVESLAGKHDRARKFLLAAVDAKTSDAEAYFELARYRFGDASAKPEAPDGRFSAEQTKGIVNLLLTARTLPPADPAVFELLADTWLRSSVQPVEADVMPLIVAAHAFPTRLDLVYATAALCHRAGVDDAAQALTAHGVKYAPDAETKARFERLRATLPQPPATPAARPAKG